MVKGDFDATESVGQSILEIKLEKLKIMSSNFFALDQKDWWGVVVSAVLVAILGYILKVGDVFALDWKSIVNVAVLAGAGRLLETLLTTSDGKVAGVFPVK